MPFHKRDAEMQFTCVQSEIHVAEKVNYMISTAIMHFVEREMLKLLLREVLSDVSVQITPPVYVSKTA